MKGVQMIILVVDEKCISRVNLVTELSFIRQEGNIYGESELFEESDNRFTLVPNRGERIIRYSNNIPILFE